MQEEKKISFSAQDNGLSSFMKRMQQDSRQLFNDFAKEAKKQSDSSKDQLRIIEAQIKALKEQNRLEQEQSRIILDRKRASGSIGDNSFTSSLSQAKEDSRVNKMQVSVLNQMLAEMKGNQREPENRPMTSGHVVGAVLTAGIIRDILGGLKTMTGAGSGFDLISPAATSAGTAAGALAGSWTGYLSPGLPASITQAGRELGSFAGAGYTRHLMTREQHESASLRVSGLTGQSGQAGDLSQFGIDKIKGSGLEESIVRAIGRGTTAQQIKNIAAITKAYSIESGTMTGYLGLGRMGSDVSEENIAEFFAQGIDRSRLGDAFQSVTTLMQLMGSSTLSPNRIDAMQQISEYNSLGGPFSVGDPRSAGLISTVHSNLTAPKSAFGQAMSYAAIRQMNPNMSVLELEKARQAGGSLYNRTMMEGFSGLGNEDIATMMFARESGLGGNMAAAELLFKGRGNIAAGGNQYRSLTGDQTSDLYREAGDMTSMIDKSTAQVTNAFITGFTEGIAKLATNFTDIMTREIEIWVAEKSDSIKAAFDVNSKDSNDKVWDRYSKGRN